MVYTQFGKRNYLCLTLFYLYGRATLLLEYGFYPVGVYPKSTVFLYRSYSNFRSVGIETKNRRFYASFSYKAIFTKLQKYYFLRGFHNFSRQSQNAAPATTFDTVSCLRSPDIAIYEEALWTRHKMLRLPRKCKTPHCKVLRLPRGNDTLALTHKVLRLSRKTRK